MASSVLNFLLVGTDAGASRAIARVGGAAEAASASIKKSGDASAAAAASVGKAFNAVGKLSAAIVIGIGIEGVRAAIQFESALTRVSTQAGVSQRDLKGLGDQLLKLSPKVGFDPSELATSLYHVESAFHSTGITAGKAIDIVEQASKLAKIGNANLEDTTQAIIGTLASKISGIKNATDAAAQLNQLVGSGDTTLEAVTKAIGTGILPSAQTLGLSFRDISAGLATLSDNATPIDEAATRFRTTLSIIGAQSPKTAAALSGIGLSTTQLSEDFRKPKGLLVAMEDLQTHLNAVYPLQKTQKLTTDQITASTKSYVAQLEAQAVPAKTAIDLGNKYADSLKKGGSAAGEQAKTILNAFGGAKSGSTFLTLFNELDRLRSKYDESGTSAQAAAKFTSAWVQTQGTAKQKLDELKASWKIFEIQVGNAILPDLKKIVDVLAKHPGIIKAAAGAVALLAAAWTVSTFASAFAVIGRLTTAILGIGTASTTAAAETAAANLGSGAVAARGAGIVALDGSAAALAGGAAAGKARSPSAYQKLFAGTDAEFAGGAAARGGAGLLGGLSLGTAVGAGVATAGAVLIPSFLLANQLGKKQSVRDIPQIDKFINRGPDFLENKIPGLKSDELKQRLIDYANKIGGLDLKLKNFYGDAADNKAIGSFQQALKNSTVDLQSSSRSLDLHTAKNDTDKASILSNQSALGNLAGKAVLAAKAYEHGTGVLSDYTSNLQLSVPQILDQAQATGISRQAAADYLNKIIQIPGYHVTTLGLVKDAAEKAVNDFLIALSQIPKSIQVPIITFLANPIPANQLAGSAFGVDTTGFRNKASGGLLRGPGSGTSDSMLARVSNGEFVVKASSVNRYGVGFLNAVNAGSYARGGYVGSAVRAGGGDVHVHLTVETLDSKSFQQRLDGGLAKDIAISIKKATNNGMRLN